MSNKMWYLREHLATKKTTPVEFPKSSRNFFQNGQWVQSFKDDNFKFTYIGEKKPEQIKAQPDPTSEITDNTQRGIQNEASDLKPIEDSELLTQIAEKHEEAIQEKQIEIKNLTADFSASALAFETKIKELTEANEKLKKENLKIKKQLKDISAANNEMKNGEETNPTPTPEP